MGRVFELLVGVTATMILFSIMNESNVVADKCDFFSYGVM